MALKKHITPQHIEQAKRRFSFTNLKNSIRQGGGNIYGAVGEILTIEHYRAQGKTVLDSPTYDYDLIIEGCKVDIKTRVGKSSPRGWYRCNIPAYSIRQKTEFYIFVHINKDLKTAYLLGYIEKEEFLNIARFYKKGEPDGGGFVFACDTYQIIHRQLKRLK